MWKCHLSFLSNHTNIDIACLWRIPHNQFLLLSITPMLNGTLIFLIWSIKSFSLMLVWYFHYTPSRCIPLRHHYSCFLFSSSKANTAGFHKFHHYRQRNVRYTALYCNIYLVLRSLISIVWTCLVGVRR